VFGWVIKGGEEGSGMVGLWLSGEIESLLWALQIWFILIDCVRTELGLYTVSSPRNASSGVAILFRRAYECDMRCIDIVGCL
jgi:hypothetical protein